MHGIVLLAYRRYLADRFGPAIAIDVFSGTDPIDVKKVYEDVEFQRLLRNTGERVKMVDDRVLREFGAHAISIFHDQYPGYFPSEGARRFLLQVEETIHARVREIIPGASPPNLHVTDLGAGQIRIEYQSSRRLCAMLAGFLEGTSVHYQTPVRYTEQQCTRRGDASCVFLVSVQQTLLPRGRFRQK